MHITPKKLVCFGGGTGLPSLLRGLRHIPWLEPTAIVNMFDSGGSSGILRDQFGILPPGDILKCLLSLADDEESARRLLLRRTDDPLVPGHTGGNLLLLALEMLYHRDYYRAIDALGTILDIRGAAIPVTLESSTLCARFTNGCSHEGETSVDIAIYEQLEVAELLLKPPVQASDRALNAIGTADIICIGPGSFYTSVMPNFLPHGITEALRASKAPIVFICNLVTEGAGMQGHTPQHLTQLVESMIGRPVARTIVNSATPNRTTLARYAEQRKYPLLLDAQERDQRFVTAALWVDPDIARHDSDRLADIVLMLTYELCVLQEQP